MLILICSLINISGNNSPIGIGGSSNDSKRALEEQIDNYIILQYNKDVTYAGRAFLYYQYGNNIYDYNQYISYIKNGNETIDRNTQFTVESNTKLEVHFNQTIRTLQRFLDGVKDKLMFNSLILADFCHFDTSSVTNMNYMFNKLSLEYLNLSNFDTSSVRSMEAMFYDCNSLKYLIISNFNFTKTDSTSGIFSNVNALKYIDISNIKNPKV